jgi:hypothetical protein
MKKLAVAPPNPQSAAKEQVTSRRATFPMRTGWRFRAGTSAIHTL